MKNKDKVVENLIKDIRQTLKARVIPNLPSTGKGSHGQAVGYGGIRDFVRKQIDRFEFDWYLKQAEKIGKEEGEKKINHYEKTLKALDKSHQEEIKKLMKRFRTKKITKWTFPKKDCTFQGFITVNGEVRVICDTVGDDVSKEFCMYCQYWTEAMKHKNWKPYQTAERMTRLFCKDFDWDEELKQARLSESDRIIGEIEKKLDKLKADIFKDKTIEMLYSGRIATLINFLKKELRQSLKKKLGKGIKYNPETEQILQEFELFYASVVSNKERKDTQKWLRNFRREEWRRALKEAKGDKDRAFMIYGNLGKGDKK